jgi:hypothetical protein
VKELRIPIKNWELIAMINEQDGEQLIAIKSICEQLGLDDKSQRRRIQSDPRYRWGHMTSTGSDGKKYRMLCLPVKQLNVWLCTVNTKKVTPELQEKLMAFQEECALAIYNHFNGTVNPQVIEVLVNRIQELEKRLQIHDQLAGIESSAAGKRLAAARHLKLVGE